MPIFLLCPKPVRLTEASVRLTPTTNWTLTCLSCECLLISNITPGVTLPIYPGFGQASNMLACTTSGVVGNMYRKLHESFFRYAHEQTDKETHKHSDRNILHPACGQSNYIQQPLEFKCNLTASESYIIRQVTNKQSIRNAHSTYHSACKTLHIPVLRTINNVLSVTFSKCCLKSHGQR